MGFSKLFKELSSAMSDSSKAPNRRAFGRVVGRTSEGYLVKVDGSPIATACRASVAAAIGERVEVSFRDHAATVTRSAEQEAVVDYSERLDEIEESISDLSDQQDEDRESAEDGISEALSYVADTEPGEALVGLSVVEKTVSTGNVSGNSYFSGSVSFGGAEILAVAYIRSTDSDLIPYRWDFSGDTVHVGVRNVLGSTQSATLYVGALVREEA